MICWFSDGKTLRQGGKYLFRHTTKEAQAIVTDVRYKVDVNTLHRMENDSEFAMNDGDLGVGRRASIPDLVGALKRLDLDAIPCAEGAWVQLLGTPSRALAEKIRGHGFEVRAVQHHTWREGLLVTSAGTGEKA